MSNKILTIEKVGSERVGSSDFEGYRVVTENETVELLIDEYQCCCEDFGYFMSEDDLHLFIGAELKDVEVVDTELRVGSLAKERNMADSDDLLDDGDVMFVNLLTSVGTLQFVAYNAHNGYYGHEALVRRRGNITHRERL